MTQIAQVSEAWENVAMYSSKNTNNNENYKPKRSQVQCEYCHYKGHTKEICYKLVGYPPDFKSKKKGINTGQYANQVCGAEVNCTDKYIMGSNVASSVTQQGRGGSHTNSGVPKPTNQPTFFQQMSHRALVFTPEQYQQIVHLLSKGSIEGSDSSSKLVVADLFSGQVKGIGKKKHRLYILCGNTSISASSQHLQLRHKRLGYAAIDIIKKIETLSKLTTGHSNQSCTGGPVAKQTKMPFQLSNTITTFTWIFLLNSKSEATIILRDFLTQANNVFSTTVKILRTDNGSEFFSIEFRSPFEKLYLYPPSLPRLERFRNLVFPVLDLLSPELNVATHISSSTPTIEDSTEPVADTTVSEPIIPTMSDYQDDAYAETCAIQSYPAEPLEECRGSSRPSKSPAWLQDYVTISKGSKCTYHISSYISYSHISPTFRQALTAYSALTQPTTFKEAATDPRWVKAMQLEIDALEDNHTWSIIDLPPGKTPIGYRWVYKIKYKASGKVEKFKARLVAKGYSQKEGLDYGKTFSPVAKIVTIRSIITLAASKQWLIFQMDVNNAFLNGDLIEEVYMHIPEGFARQGDTHKKVLSQFMHYPKNSHKETSLRVVQYINEAPALGLMMPAESSSKLIAYCDSDWGACIQTRRSVTGYLVKFGNALISRKSKKQSTISRSSTEAEFRSMASCAAEVTWLTSLYSELGVKIELSITLICDSKTAIQIAVNPLFHERTKHIDID
ncbi:uncharacterized protein LOC142172624 [Nicotiana tabacum]|uniref:Uncharacterized protein LOC142172624 n=1 Tax=Nicotiana tabacum TaxID=4097 RepID=A0AC58T575_TOBAC